MTTKDPIQTPLFQLNLLIYLCWRSNNVIKPVFLDHGYELFYIGRKIPVQPDLLTKARRANPPIAINKLVSPDLILRNKVTKVLLPIECKQNSFGPDSDNSKQACALLTLTGNSLSQYFGLAEPNQWKSKVFYVVGEEKSELMQRTLDSLTDHLRENKFDLSDYYSLEISIESDGVYLKCPNNKPCEIFEIDSSIKVMELESGETPSFLYLIPIDPDVNLQSDYEQLEFKERIRTGIASTIGMKINQKNFSIEDDELFKSIVEVWDYWDNPDSKKALRSEIGKYVNKVIEELRKLGLIIYRDGNSIICSNVEKNISKKVREYFLSEKFKNGNIELDFEGQLPFEFYYDKTISHSDRRR